MLESNDWIDITCIGDDYRVEMTVDGKMYRHRPFSMSEMMHPPRGDPRRLQIDMLEDTDEGWIRGRPPTGTNRG